MFESTDIAVDEIRNHPERLVDLVLASNDRSLILERRADVVRITYLKPYTQDVQRVVAEARQAYATQKAEGYDREQAYQDLLQAQTAIAEHMSKPD